MNIKENNDIPEKDSLNSAEEHKEYLSFRELPPEYNPSDNESNKEEHIEVVIPEVVPVEMVVVEEHRPSPPAPPTPPSLQPQPIVNPYKKKKKSNPLGLSGFILIILSYLTMFVGGGLVFWPLGTIFCIIGIFKKPRLWAFIGLILALIYVPLILWLLSLVPVAFGLIGTLISTIAGAITSIAPFLLPILLLLIPYFMDDL